MAVDDALDDGAPMRSESTRQQTAHAGLRGIAADLPGRDVRRANVQLAAQLTFGGGSLFPISERGGDESKL